MPNNLVFTVRYLQPYMHGRGEGGEPEWPPSPLRFVQSLVAAAAAHWNERYELEHAKAAMQWLETLPVPEIVAASGIASSVPTQFYVPDNTADLLVPAWKKGEWDKPPKRTEKVVRPTHFLGDTLHYLFSLPDGHCPYLETLQSAARSITHLGWGIDMVVADATVISEEEASKLSGHRWRETYSGGVPLRVPISGTLEDLMRKHQNFLKRISHEGFRPVPPLRAYRVARYHSATAACDSIPVRPWCAFSLLLPDMSRNSAYNPTRRTRDIAGWMRHAVGEVCQGWPFDDSVEAFVHGHDGADKPIKGEKADRRFQYLPLPSVERRGEQGNHLGAIRRVLLAAPAGCSGQLEWVGRRLRIADLQDKETGEVRCVLSMLPRSDWVVRQYVEPARMWYSVTPVVLPGHDDHDITKARELFYRAFRQAGWPREVLEHPEFDFDFRKVGFLPGLEHADRYVLPEHPQVKGPRYHVWVRFPQAVPGPLAVGALRYRGFGLLVGKQ